MISIVVSSGDVRALKDCWLVGDVFLHDIFHTLQVAKSDAKVGNAALPYLYEQYNITCWNDGVLSPRPVITRILNSLIDGLNDKTNLWKLLKYFIMIMDWDIIIGTELHNFGIVTILKEQIKWLVTQLMKTANRRRDEIKTRRASALSTSFEPQFIWVKMIERLYITNPKYKRVMSLRKRFNKILECVLSAIIYSYILKVESTSTHSGFFNDKGELTQLGQEQFWSEINKKMHLFDRHDIDLLTFNSNKQQPAHRPQDRQ